MARRIASIRFKITSCTISHHSYPRICGFNQVQSKSQVKILHFLNEKKNSFHTSERRNIPPILAVIIRPLIRLAALLFGRKFRKWYASRTPEERKEFLKWLQAKKNFFVGNLSNKIFNTALYLYTSY